jgi:hypothetical protein
MKKLLLAGVMVLSVSSADARVQIPGEFVNQWCLSAPEDHGETNYVTPSWNSDKECKNIFVVEPWDFYANDGGPTWIPIKVTVKEDNAPSGTAYIARITARAYCASGEVCPKPETFEFTRYKGNLTVRTEWYIRHHCHPDSNSMQIKCDAPP